MNLAALWLVGGCEPSEDPAPPPIPAEVVALQTPPETEAWLTVTAAEPLGIRDLVAVPTPARPGPMTLSWSWTVDDRPAEPTGDRVPAHLVHPGERWTVTVIPEQGGHQGPAASASLVVPEPVGGNVLLVILDDLGADVFSPGAVRRTPTLDRLTAEGVYFDRAYASPVCSPTRAHLLTGRHASRTGVGNLVGGDGYLPLEALTLPEVLQAARAGGYTSAAVGKYHLSAPGSPSGHLGPNLQGFGWYSGSNGNLDAPETFYDWDKFTNGVKARSATFATTDTVNDALGQVEVMPEPWFLHLAFNATHVPWGVPPAELITVPVEAASPDWQRFDANLEAADTELGRLLEEMDPEVLARTTVIVIGDNGTGVEAVRPPFDPERAKHTVYEGGTRVPLLVAGLAATTPGARSSALVHAVDVMATVADLAGVPLGGTEDHLALDLGPEGERALDGQSLLRYVRDPELPGLRDVVLVEKFAPLGPPPHTEEDLVALTDPRFKLIRERTAGEEHLEFYDLDTSEVDEGLDLLVVGMTAEQQAAFDRLSARLEQELAALPYEGF